MKFSIRSGKIFTTQSTLPFHTGWIAPDFLASCAIRSNANLRKKFFRKETNNYINNLAATPPVHKAKNPRTRRKGIKESRENEINERLVSIILGLKEPP